MAPIKDEEFENVNPVGEPRVLVPAGVYPARCLGHSSKSFIPWGEKLILKWEIFTSPDLSSSVVLRRFYNIQRDGGGRLDIGDGHEYRKDWIRANDGRWPQERRKVPVSKFKERYFLVRVVTVTRDNQGPLEPCLHWSKIGRVLRPLGGDEKFERLPIQLADLSNE